MITSTRPTIKTGQPVKWESTSGESLTMTPQWSSQDGESLRVTMDSPVDFTESDFFRFYQDVEKLMDGYRKVWEVTPGNE